MRSGKLRHRVHVETPKETGKDERGQPIITWQRNRNWQCDINQLSLRQQEVARQLYSDATHEVTGRWFPNLTVEHRLVFKGRLLHIREVNNVSERDKEYMLICAEGVV